MEWIHITGRAYWALFVASFLGVAVWESFRPTLVLSEGVERRWGRHSVLLIVAIIVSALVIPLNPVLLAASLNGSRYGLLSRPWLPFGLRFVLAILLIDLTRYASHRALHSFGILWRVHQIHHSDRDLDVSTSVRAHPLEVLFFHATNLLAVAVLVAPPVAVFAAQLVSVFESFFSHANSVLPDRLQRMLGIFLFTSNTHRIHHTVDLHRQNTNFGDIFPWWDMLFGTYSAPLGPEDEGPGFGLADDESLAHAGVGLLLKQPFLRGSSRTPLAESRTGSS